MFCSQVSAEGQPSIFAVGRFPNDDRANNHTPPASALELNTLASRRSRTTWRDRPLFHSNTGIRHSYRVGFVSTLRGTASELTVPRRPAGHTFLSDSAVDEC